MAITGGLVRPTPGSRSAGFPVSEFKAEASALTHYLGWPLFLTAGYLSSIATNGTLLYGISSLAGQNGASDGAKTTAVYRIKANEIFEATLSVASWDQSLVGSKVAYSVISSVPVLVTATALSASAQCMILGVSSLWAAGDSKPVVYYTHLAANVQGGV